VPVFIGTSGWQYSDWAGAFYPKGLPKSQWLEFYAQRFQTLESNNAFYKLPSSTVFGDWSDRTPDDFIMSVKASRYLTHIKRLHDPAQPIDRLMERARPLGKKIGPILLQLPPNLAVSIDSMEQALSAFPRSTRVAVEVRNSSWFVDEFRVVLEKHQAALCLTDRNNRHSPLWRTADWGYVRFHEGTASPRPSYGRSALDSWAERIASLWASDEDVFCYFNNDANSCAPRDAHHLALAVKRHGLEPTRTGARNEMTSE
jgi:uncharacterized protein YecE (DUF72 family)